VHQGKQRERKKNSDDGVGGLISTGAICDFGGKRDEGNQKLDRRSGAQRTSYLKGGERNLNGVFAKGVCEA